jgi:hypothetical protein
MKKNYCFLIELKKNITTKADNSIKMQEQDDQQSKFSKIENTTAENQE